METTSLLFRALCGCVTAVSAGAAAPASAPAAAGDAAKTAAAMVDQTGASGGICAVIGRADAELAAALSKQGNFVVHCLVPAADDCTRLRTSLRARGLCGCVSAAVLDGTRLPYVDNLVNLVVVPAGKGQAQRVPAEEIRRVLTPGGVAFIRKGEPWVKTVKPRPETIDEWTHYLHGADGNPVARDRVVGPPMHYQWTAGPTWLRSHETDSSVSTLVTAAGRLFYIIDRAPISLPGDHELPDNWFLAARDAFNGVPLWEVPIRRWGWREWKPSWFNTRPGDIPLNIQKRLVAAGDKVYVTLGYHAPVSQLDARTGRILRTYAGTDPTGEILFLDGTLVLSVLSGDRMKVMAVDAAGGRRRWVSEKTYAGSTVDYIRWRAMRGGTKPAKLDPSVNLAADGDAVALIDGDHVACLDFKTGAQRWRSKFPLEPADLRAGGIQTRGKLWIGTMIVRGGVVLHASPNKLAAFSAKTGKLLWQQPKKYIGHLWYEWKDVFVIDGLAWTWGADLERGKLTRGRGRRSSLYPTTVRGYDLHTGEMKRKVDLGYLFKTHHHHRCYRNKATSRYILASRRGTEYVDLKEGRHTLHNWVRGTCHVGMMPANGLQYVPPHPCVCYIDEKLNGLLALAPERASAKLPAAPAARRLTRGPAYGKIENRKPKIENQDWPTFRGDAMRTGASGTRLPDAVAPLWRTALGGRLSAPVAAGGRVFVAAVDAHHVVCLDAGDGRKLWEFAAGARVDSAPTCRGGTVLFGSADGCVYCLRAADGALVWRFRAAPQRRLIAVDAQLESAWPVHGSVLVRDGKVYFAAGRSSQLDGGIYVFALAAETGKVLHHTHLAGPDYLLNDKGEIVVNEAKTSAAMKPKGPFKENYVLPMGALAGVMAEDDAGNIHMRAETFDAELNRKRGKAELTPRAGFLDANYFKRTPWTFAGQYARLIVRDADGVYYVRMFDSLRGLDPSVYFTPGAKGYLLFANSADGRKRRWAYRVPVRIRAMAAARGRLVVAGPPDVVARDDPLGAFEGRKGGLLYVIDSASGRKLCERKLASPPVFNGIAAARGRIFLAAEDGSVVCFAKAEK